MSREHRESTGSDSLERARRVNAACERHEEAWRDGRKPRIEDELDRGPGGDPPELLVELIALEVELRRGRGEGPTPEEYLSRFPDRGSSVVAAFRHLEGEAEECDKTRTYYADAPCAEGEERTIALGAGPWSSTPGWAGPGQDLGDFELLEEVARGGMGIVYKAHKRSLNCLVALKVIQAGPLATEAEKRRFIFEAEAAANLDHPNIVPVYEIDREGGLYFTMKWVDGGSLSQHVPRLVGDPLAAARLMVTVALAVHDAHRHGYLHRDLKPANILLDAQGKPYVTDFGLARRLGEDSGLTQSGAILGTPSYMAPEQAGGHGECEEVGPTADVYSLGAVLYELLVGRPPFRAATVMETLVLVLERDPTPPRRLEPGVPPDLESICLKCLEKDPADRYPSAQALSEDLERSLRGEDVEAMQAGPWLRLRRWTRREPQLVTHLIGLAAIQALTQLNYLTTTEPFPRIHFQVTVALTVWALATIALQAIARRNRWQGSVRLAWATVDVVMLTLILWLLEAVGSSMVVGYPLLVASSGLWFRVRLVWVATAFAEAGYALLVLDAWSKGMLGRHDHPNIVMAAIAVTGFVVARQVKRLLLLSSYYEQRLPD